MTSPRSPVALTLAALLCVVPAAVAQQNAPHLAYVLPAGVQLGTSFEVRVGGRVYTLHHDEVRWLFGQGKPGKGLPSTLFTLEIQFGREFHPSRFVFRGAGWGHGLGLCQWGANGRAKAGQTAEQILKAYFPGAEITRL